MRQGLAVVLAIWIGLTTGCVSDRVQRSASLFNPLRHFSGPVGDDVVQLDIAVVERPIGDRYINRELWDLADEQCVAFEKKGPLDDNGLRVGLIGGMTPAGLQALLTSERSCAAPHRVRLHAGNGTPVNLGPLQKHCEFNLVRDGQSTRAEFEGAQCQLEVVPVLSENGKTTLRFIPRVKHGETTLAPHPLQEPAGTRRWELQARQPSETYDKLTWEVALPSGDYVIVGTRLERPDTLGQRSFLLAEGNTPIQRLLVIRACRPEPGNHSRESILSKSPPLALQAGWSSARGTSP